MQITAVYRFWVVNFCLGLKFGHVVILWLKNQDHTKEFAEWEKLMSVCLKCVCDLAYVWFHFWMSCFHLTGSVLLSRISFSCLSGWKSSTWRESNPQPCKCLSMRRRQSSCEKSSLLTFELLIAEWNSLHSIQGIQSQKYRKARNLKLIWISESQTSFPVLLCVVRLTDICTVELKLTSSLMFYSFPLQSIHSVGQLCYTLPAQPAARWPAWQIDEQQLCFHSML